jgi:hypothetical protein
MSQNAEAAKQACLKGMAADPVLREYFRHRASHAARARSPLERRLTALRTSKRAWALRRLRYGPTGRKPVDKRLASRLAGDPVGAWAIAYDPMHHAGSSG